MSDNCEEYLWQQQAYENYLYWQNQDAMFYGHQQAFYGEMNAFDARWAELQVYTPGNVASRLDVWDEYMSAMLEIHQNTGLPLDDLFQKFDANNWDIYDMTSVSNVVDYMEYQQLLSFAVATYKQELLESAAAIGLDTSQLDFDVLVAEDGSYSITPGEGWDSQLDAWSAGMPDASEMTLITSDGYRRNAPAAGSASAVTNDRIKSEIERALKERLAELVQLQKDARDVYNDPYEVAELERQIRWTTNTLAGKTDVPGGTVTYLNEGPGAQARVQTGYDSLDSTGRIIPSLFGVVQTNWNLDEIRKTYATGATALTSAGYNEDLLPGYAGIKQIVRHESQHSRLDNNSHDGYPIYQDPAGTPANAHTQLHKDEQFFIESNADSRSRLHVNGQLYYGP
jgi:peptidyl-tRNA hydrolase